MRRTLGTLGALLVLGLASAGAVACDSSPGIMDTTLGFTINEGLLVLLEGDSTLGKVVLASNTGNCTLFQTGAGPNQIFLSDFLTFDLEAVSVNGLLPLTAGTYTILGPGQAPTTPGLYADSIEIETNAACGPTNTGANSGSLTLQPFSPDAGGVSDVSYSVVFGYNRFSGAYPVLSCIVPATATIPDAGTCLIPGGV